MRRFLSPEGARREDGSIFVAGAIALVVFSMLGAGVLEAGQWYAKRHTLQVRTDAAALAAGQTLNACFNIGAGGPFPTEADADTFIENWAKNYGGFSSAVSTQTGAPYNQDATGGHGTTYMSFQSDAYPSSGVPQPTPNLKPECFKDGNPANTADPNLNLMTDVRTTQSGIAPWFSFSPLGTVHGWARVQLQAIKALKPSLPLAVPDVNPLHVSVTFVDNSTGQALAGCPNGCVFPLTGPTLVTTLNNWSGTATLPIPAPNTNVGMRVAIGSANGSCAGVNGSTTYTCYDYSNGGQPSTRGIVAIRSYSTAAVAGTPILRQVTPTTCLPTNAPGGSPFFSAYQAPAGTCSNVGLTANVDFPTGATNKQVSYDINNKGTCKAATNMTATGVGNQFASPLSSLTTSAGAYDVCIDYSYGPGTNKGSFAAGNAVQQIFSGSDGSDSTAPGGPIFAVSLVNDATGLPAYSLPANQTSTVDITLGLTGGVHVNPRCFGSGPGKTYTCATDPTIVLRAASTSGSLNYAIDCGVIPGNPGSNDAIYQEVRYGCKNSFGINTADVCPDPANPTPTDCADVVTGDKVGPVQSAMNDRLAPNHICKVNHYPDTSVSGDPRIFRLVDTDFSAYAGSGGTTQVPVVTFATFYVTGWDGADNGCSTQNEPPPPNAVSNGNSANIWGHFISYDSGDGTPSGITCKLGALAPCTAALVR